VFISFFTAPFTQLKGLEKTMRKVIEKILYKYKDSQLNLSSFAARRQLAIEIENALLTRTVSDNKFFDNKEDWLVDQYNRNRPIEEHIKIAQEIENE
jgi:hypothetical protein|tara:strand:- start:2276 stop:2566 length:291 start_codon:yes stop_codon:yes gene_type:complete